MSIIYSTTTLAEPVTTRPELAPDIGGLGLGYCGGGERTLAATEPSFRWGSAEQALIGTDQ